MQTKSFLKIWLSGVNLEKFISKKEDRHSRKFGGL